MGKIENFGIKKLELTSKIITNNYNFKITSKSFINFSYF